MATVAAFAEDSRVQHLAIREPEISGPIHFGQNEAVDQYGLAALFPPDLTGYHDGAEVPLAVALELLRAMLRDNGAWCRLEVQDKFFVHVGFDQYVYVGSSKPCERAVAHACGLGLFAERLDVSPYDPSFNEEPGEQRPADDAFWDRLSWYVSTGEAAILEEGYVQNASRWHRLTQANLDAVRGRLAPRAQLTVWPDLSTDIDAVRDALPEEGTIELVWEDQAGQITSTFADEESFEELNAPLTDARAAAVLPLTLDERHPLFTAVLPDSDGVLRARWRTQQTPSDVRWSQIKALQRGQVCSGVVTSIADFGALVDISGLEGVVTVPERSGNQPVKHQSEIIEVGQKVTVEIVDADMVRERVALSLKATQDAPRQQPSTAPDQPLA
ncbi:S1 RNA-binding domain-containing protein [Streptomyces sp. NBC_00322]|uniref:S1 RNA-binding domain-containing protein n=1 Tax=Streptomyces sp. NBC_00322 TaxID=2975712 RepID=UPI002E298D2F|nr:S1 RNA-binding domain-containing protein [Streptomyces sp. NBC_00322]